MKSFFTKIDFVIGGLVIAALILLSLTNLPSTSGRPTLPLVWSQPGIALPWPGSGQAALSAQGFGLLGTSGTQTPVPTASVAKMITALSVLSVKPLHLGEQGPVITLDNSDVAAYQMYLSQGGSVAPVVSGEQITEYQMLQAMILPSANNVAFSLAAWAFHYLDEYVVFANSYVKTLGMTNTHVADASGFNPATTSTAQDLVKLAQAAMANPVLAQIVGQQQATVPVAGTVSNTNWLLGVDGIVGIKTGNTDQAGGCYLFAAKHTVLGQNLMIYGAVVDSPDLPTALRVARNLTETVDVGFQMVTPIKAGQTVATYKTRWGTETKAIAQTDLSMLVWRGQKLNWQTNLSPLDAGAKAHSPLGTITLTADSRSVSVPIISAAAASRPPMIWRILHP